MRPIARRTFITSALTGGVGCLIGRRLPAARAQGVGSRIEIIPAEPIGAIAPEIYGHFIEHLGGVIYDGVWVGEDTNIRNTGGIRQGLTDGFRGDHRQAT